MLQLAGWVGPLLRMVASAVAVLSTWTDRRAGSVAANSVTPVSIGVMLPVNDPGPTKVRPVTKAVALVGSSAALGSIPVTVKVGTPPEGKKNWVLAARAFDVC